VLYALLAYTSWGITPVYWKALAAVSPYELLLHRVVWTLLFVAVLLTVARRWSDVQHALRRRRQLAALAGSACLLVGNWGVFIWAVQNGHILATSLGYYLNPLVNVGIGMLVLRERLSPLQLVAVALAAAGVAYLAVASGTLPWISLVLAFSFASYGLIRKTVGVGSLAGLTVEMAWLAPIAAAAIAWREATGVGVLGRGAELGAWVPPLVLAAGPITALPLIWFTSAARRLRFATVGLFQYIAPSLTLVLATVVYGEPFTRVHAVAFACIWTALVLYSVESVRTLRALTGPEPPPAVVPSSSSSGP
jgi:chloramphenicol-sensitive protein RarD